jgi:hypothetical protein
MSKANDITYLKAEAVRAWTAIPIPERLSTAEFIDGDTHGCIYHGIVRIYIDRQGNLTANKPKASKMTNMARR